MSLASAATGRRSQFLADDGAPLHYKTWLPADPATRHLVLLHRGHEHADRWDPVVPHLGMPKTAIHAWEARGHGASAGRRGHAAGFMQYVRDVDAFFRHLQSHEGLDPHQTILIAHSVGAVVAATYVHDYAPTIAGLVLVTPAFDVNLMVPGALGAIRTLQKIKSDATIKSYVRGSWLTRDVAAAAAYDADQQISKDISAKILVDLFDTSDRIIRDAAVIDRPLLLFSAGADRVVKRRAIDTFYRFYGAEQKVHLTMEGARHALFHDLCRDEVCAAIRRFSDACLGHFAERRLTEDLSHPATNTEFEALCRPLGSPSLRGLSFTIQRAVLGSVGRLSDGISGGHRTGFDSGESLDYVYQNKAHGRWVVGRLVDRIYLNAIGWRGIRQRRVCLDEALRFALAQARAVGMPSRLMDIAGGAGRYLLDLLEDEAIPADLVVLCRDRSQSALAAGATMARARGLADRITHVVGDAFDPVSLRAAGPQSVAVVSGLYELFPDNAPIAASLGGLFACLGPGGRLVYTNQPWHPQVEMIARTLTNRDGKQWIMRRRPQSEMDALVEAAGFRKQRQWVDDFGIFTVSVASKPIE